MIFASSSNDYDNERYEYLKKVISAKEEIGIFDHEYKEKSKPYSELIEIEGYAFIKKEVENNKNYYVLDKKEHPLLFKEHNAYDYDIEKETKKEIYHRQGYRCNICEKVITKEEGIVDYILPLLRGGKEENDNIQLICNECYTKKRKECKNCIEVCNIKNCPLYRKTNTISAMTVTRVAMRKTK